VLGKDMEEQECSSNVKEKELKGKGNREEAE
jgi:hypothetical protein